MKYDEDFEKIKKWDLRFLELADKIASWSKDPRKKVGAIVVSDKVILSTGFNGIPKTVPDTDDILLSPNKNDYMCHAERNALDQLEVSAKGATIYSTLYPCVECAKSIIQKGIKKVVSWYPTEAEKKEYWQKCKWDVTIDMFKQAKIEEIGYLKPVTTE